MRGEMEISEQSWNAEEGRDQRGTKRKRELSMVKMYKKTQASKWPQGTFQSGNVEYRLENIFLGGALCNLLWTSLNSLVKSEMFRNLCFSGFPLVKTGRGAALNTKKAFYWRIVDLQHCVSFRHTAKWIRCTYVVATCSRKQTHSEGQCRQWSTV